MIPPFHLALPVDDLETTRRFYVDVLGGCEGRSAPTWVDVGLFGHQLSFHLGTPAATGGGAVDGDAVPIPHFGLVLPLADWRALVDRVLAAGVTPMLGPKVRFEGAPGEQRSVFLRDPSGHVIELKGFADLAALFTA